MTLYFKTLLLFAALACMATSCEPEEPPDPEETFWRHIYPIERELFDFPKGSYWVMQNTLDTTQIDTFMRIRHDIDTLVNYVGNDIYIDVLLQVDDITVNSAIPTGVSYRQSSSPYLYVGTPDDFLVRARFDYTSSGVLKPRVERSTEIQYPSAEVVRFQDNFLGGYIDLERNIGLLNLYGADSLWTRIDYYHTN